MKIYQGKGVCGGVTIGTISVFQRQDMTVKRTHTEHPEEEKKRIDAARELSIKQLEEIYEKALKEVGEANAQIFEIHRMMLEDEDYIESICNIIETQQVTADYAVAVTSDNFARMFASMGDTYMQARATDVRDVSNRMIKNMNAEQRDYTYANDKMIICADDLAPSETVSLDKEKVVAFVTAHGSSNSHTAILARNMGIPAIIGVGTTFLEEIKTGMQAAVDGTNGFLYIEPEEEMIRKIEEKEKEEKEKRELLLTLKGKENVTLDGKSINVFANISNGNEMGAVLLHDAGGIGLFRSEFLYLEGEDVPTEQEQLLQYKQVLESMGGKEVIIRTLDIGADKQVDYLHLEKEENPALGCRAIRLCLTRPELFKTQLRALYRASVYGRLGIMFPMINSVWEVEEIKKICEEVKEELKNQGLAYSDDVEIGIMIETPAAAIISDKLAPLVNFFSIGTNDLTQYTLACDRQNPILEDFCNPHHEAVLRLIQTTVKNAHLHGTWVGICGELAGDTSLTEQFMRMEVDELSVSPNFVLRLREVIRSLDLSK